MWGVSLPLDCQRAIPELSPQFSNPLGETAPQPGEVNYLQSYKAVASGRGCSEVGSKLVGRVSFSLHQPECTRHRPTASFLHLAVSNHQAGWSHRTWLPPAWEMTFIWHSQNRMICCSVDYSSLKMGGSSVSPTDSFHRDQQQVNSQGLCMLTLISQESVCSAWSQQLQLQ